MFGSNQSGGVDRGLNGDINPQNSRELLSGSSLKLPDGRTLSKEELTSEVEHIIRDRAFSKIGEGIEFRVYAASRLEGIVFKLPSKRYCQNRLVLTPHHPSESESSMITNELVLSELAVPSVKLRVTIPVQSLRTGNVNERTVSVVLQPRVERIEDRLRDAIADRQAFKEHIADYIKFQLKLLSAGFLAADLDSVKNVGYITQSDGSQRLYLFDSGFVYRLPTDRAERREALASFGGQWHPTLGEFLVGSIFDRFYAKALKHPDVSRILRPLLGSLFPSLESKEMAHVHKTYLKINKSVRALPPEERVAAYLKRVRDSVNREVINSVLDKLYHPIERA